METIHDVAAAISKLVAESLPGDGGVLTRDVNDEYLCAAYGRAFRCFTSIRELARRQEADDALVLLRTLLSIGMKSLYLALPDDAAERRLRHRSSGLKSLRAQVTAADEQERAGFDLGDADVESVQNMVRALEAEELPPYPTEEQVARAVGFGPFYPRVYRPTSSVVHYELWSALDGYVLVDGQRQVALEMPDEERADEALELACIVYGAFLDKSESVVRHGVTEKVKARLDAYIAATYRK